MKNKWFLQTTGRNNNLFLAALILLGLLFPCLTQAGGGDTTALIRETQKMVQTEHDLTMVWWIPGEFWRESFASNPNMTPETTENFMKTLQPYMLLAVVKGKFGAFGGVTYQTENEIRSHLLLLDAQGNQYAPIDGTDISPDLQNFLSIMKPIMGNMLGAMGKNFDFYVFPAAGKDGRKIANPKVEGAFTVQLAGDNFKWRLPLGALLPKKTCPKCNEQFEGNFNYCPYDGTPLPATKP
jgi:hypothetical protein